MDGKNLMIGDWLTYEGILFQVKEITTSEVFLTDKTGKRYVSLSSDTADGIPLTKDIMDLNGFTYELDYGAFHRSIIGDIPTDNYISVGWNSKGEMTGYEIAKSSNDDVMNNVLHRKKQVSYGNSQLMVHEFQHLLHGCGYQEMARNFIV